MYLRNFSLALTFFSFLLIGDSLSAVTFPATGPSGSYSGGSFGTYFKNIMENPCPTGQVISSFQTGTLTYGQPNCVIVSGVEVDPEVGVNTVNYLPKWNGSALVTSQVFDNATNVGIGTATPSTPLNVQKNINANIPNWLLTLQNNNTETNTPTVGLLFAVGDSQSQKGGIIFQRTGPYGVGDMYFLNNNVTDSSFPTITGSTIMTLKSSGDVGIGTQSPGAKLEVAGQIKITGGAPGVGKILTSDASGLATWSTEADPEVGTNTTNYLSKWNGSALIASTVYESGGSIGIGTANPQSGFMLDVNGQIVARNNIYISGNLIEFNTANYRLSSVGNSWINAVSGNLGIGTNSPTGALDIVSGSGKIVTGNMLVGSGPTGAYVPTLTFQSTQLSGPTGWSGSTRFTYDANGFVISHNGESGAASAPPGFGLGTAGRNGDIFINSTGNVGIGTTSPGTKLEVAGQIKITGGSPGTGKVLVSDATGLATWSGIVASESDPKIGALSLNYVPKWNGTTLEDSRIFDTATGVGIGTSSPSGTLAVNGTVVGNTFYLNTGGPALSGSIDTQYGWTWWGSNISNTNTGNVGIGTLTPGAKLQVGTTSADAVLLGNIKFINNSANSIEEFFGVRVNLSDAAGGQAFRVVNNTATQVFAVKSNGKVGIGTDTPASLLTVYGNATIGSSYAATAAPANGLLVQGNVGIGTTAPNATLDVHSSSNGSRFRYNTTLTSTQVVPLSIHALTSGVIADGFGAKLAFNVGNQGFDGFTAAKIYTKRNGSDSVHDLYLEPSGSSGIVIQNSGNVGIGNTTPGKTLDVTGDIRASGELISTNANQARFIYGSYGLIQRNDGMNYYLLPTNAGDQYGTWNALRPFSINMASGNVYMGNGALTVVHGGGVAAATSVTSPNYIVAAANGNGICFWVDCTNYKVSMGNTAEYIYGPVTDYSIKNTMSTFAGRGWTWGTPGAVPVVAMSNSGNMQIAGNMTAVAYFYSSDKNLKKNIVPLNNSLGKILSLSGYSFDWKNDGRKDIGVIAQEVEKQFPDIVHTDKNTGLKSVEYGNLVAPLIEAMKEQQKVIDSQNEKIQSLESRLEKIEANLAHTK